MISHRQRLAIIPMRHQFRVKLSNFLRDETVLQRARRLLRIAESHGAQLHQSVARIAHVADVALVAGRRDRDAESTVRVDQHRRADIHGIAADTRDHRAGLHTFCADTDYPRFARHADVAYVDVVAAGCEIGGKGRGYRRGRIEIIPMIDVMFFLLATFMLASLSMRPGIATNYRSWGG
jgi:hypothetical protein